MRTTYLLIAAALLVPLLLAALTSHEVRAWLRGTGSIRQTLSNAGVGVVFLLTQLGLRGALIGLYASVASHMRWQLPETVWWTPVFAFVLLDLVYYAQHRLEHAVPLLWAIHAVHHQSRDYNLSVSFRAGALASASTALFHLVLALFGVPVSIYAAVVTVHAVLLFMLHARTKFTFGPGRFFNAPLFHRVHHGASARYIDKNFGGVFLVFDRLFGTFAAYSGDSGFGVVGEDAPDNPLAANLAPWAHLAQQVRREPTLARKLRALFMR